MPELVVEEKPKYDWKITAQKVGVQAVTAILGALVFYFMNVNPAMGAVTVGSLAVGALNYWKNRKL